VHNLNGERRDVRTTATSRLWNAQRGTNGPTNGRRISLAASRLKISPGRRRTTRIGLAAESSSSSRSTRALWRE
jgi:hypothetical protein